MNTFLHKIKKACVCLLAFCITFGGVGCSLPLPTSSDSEGSISLSESTSTLENSSSIDDEQSEDSVDNGTEDDREDDRDDLYDEEVEAGRILDMAYSLAVGESLGGVCTLTGIITSVAKGYSSSRGINLYISVNEPQHRTLYCYQLNGNGASLIGVGDTITVSGTITNYNGTIEFNKGCTVVSYVLANGNETDDTDDKDEDFDQTGDPYANINESQFYKNYSPATSNTDAYYRSLHGYMSGELTVPDQAPTISPYQPKVGTAYVRNTEMRYEENGNAYVAVDVYGNEAFTVYKNGAYITLEEVAAYVYAFGTYPKNYTESKNTKPSSSIWGEYLRVNHTAFSGDTSKYPYEPALPNITGCGGKLRYYEMDIGTTGTDCDPSYDAELYNNGSYITRGAARIVYGKNDFNGNGVYEEGELYLFYTYNHYNDFQEYLNYVGGWGEMFGNITGGGTISSKYNYNPTKYVPVYYSALSTATAQTAFACYFGA